MVQWDFFFSYLVITHKVMFLETTFFTKYLKCCNKDKITIFNKNIELLNVCIKPQPIQFLILYTIRLMMRFII